MKKIFTACLLLTAISGGGLLHAENEKLFLSANDKDGNSISKTDITLENVIRFSENGVGIYKGETLQKTFSYTDLSSLSFFVSEESGVSQVTTSDGVSLRRNPVESTLEFNGTLENKTTLNIFDLAGGLHLPIQGWSGESVDVSGLTPGLYIIKFDNKTLKFIKK